MDYQGYYERERENILRDYFAFLRFESISADPAYLSKSVDCADWLEEHLRAMSLNVERWETGGAPVLFASDFRAGEDAETLLLYCHYDVQPVDPLDEWTSPPFEPTIRDGKVYARGASDNKGQCFYTLSAIKSYITLNEGHLPVNLKFIIEGEEESGSSGLKALLSEKAETLKADHVLIVDSAMNTPQIPQITLGARGIICFKLTMQEALFDLHSGQLGGVAYNPNRALIELLSSLHDATGTVAVSGFYDEVIGPTPHELSELAMDFDQERFKNLFGFEPTGMEQGLTPMEANCLRPTLEINGIQGGYTGPGFKTVIPAKARASISCRLVPQQQPERIIALISDYLYSRIPEGLKFDLEVLPGSGAGFRRHSNSRIAEIASQSYSDVFQHECEKILMGGSVPIAAELLDVAKADGILLGTALSSDHIHSPDEHFHLDCFEKGFLSICRILELFAQNQ